MTLRILCIATMSAALLLSGCESQEQPAAKTAPHQVVKPEKPIKTEAPVKAAEAVKEEVVKTVEEAVKATEEKAEETVKEATEMAEETVKEVEDKATMMEKKIVAAVPEMPAAPKTEDVAATVSGPDEVVFKASYGNVTLPHTMHAEAYDCSTCHGESTPGSVTLGKEAAHKLCKGCHKDEGAGPTSCKGCHKK
jgi:TolA-binding protein